VRTASTGPDRGIHIWARTGAVRTVTPGGGGGAAAGGGDGVDRLTIRFSWVDRW